MNPPRSSNAIAWPEDRFYWSVLDGPGIKAGPLPLGLWSTFEEDVPCAPESLWAVCAPIDGGRVVVCAAARDLLAAVDPAITELTPASVPAFAGEVDLAGLNLLVGPFEPRSLRRARVYRHAFMAAALLMSSALTGIGLVRRGSAWTLEAAHSKTTAASVVASIGPSLGWSVDDLALELKQRREATPMDVKAPGDAALTIAGLIARWPTEVPSKPQSISATGESASISVTVAGDPSKFLSALKAPEGWTLEEPRLASIDTTTRLSLELHRRRP